MKGFARKITQSRPHPMALSLKKSGILRQVRRWRATRSVRPRKSRRQAADGHKFLKDGCCEGALALAGLKAALRLVDDVKAAAATNNLIVAVAFFQRFQRVLNFHLKS